MECFREKFWICNSYNSKTNAIIKENVSKNLLFIQENEAYWDGNGLLSNVAL